ncbi:MULTISPECIES: hypothetical protein [unclassified Spirosoma]|uniref:hypothetical protein n=1 Tax=unclassified Spirosoma TaxID=2621999 RepID=UPI0009662C0F|nr:MULTISPECIES: hypothetical protein [unclassified Spirosoma]MBN8826166.1 hypothetical protein [Spirosoma sp.]OJW76935.1 MAG: hypothetical protein BGO59_22185 [Spirosoma sp. 48-14]
MKQTAILLLSISLVCSQQACKNRQQTNTQTADTTTTAPASQPDTDVTITDRLAELGLTADSDWRGITLGDDFDKVKGAEKGEPFESDDDHVGYTIEFKNLESADMLYYQTAKKVSAIDVDLFLNNRESVNAYQKELGAYFTAHYGTPKANQWTSPNGITVTMKDVSKGKDFGLKVRMSIANGSATASAK